MPHPLNHLRKRKKPVATKNITKAHQILDKIIYVVAIGGPFLTLPQIKAIWVDNMIQGISLVTRGGYLLITLVRLAYGIVHKDKPIICAQSLWIVMYIGVISGVLVAG